MTGRYDGLGLSADNVVLRAAPERRCPVTWPGGRVCNVLIDPDHLLDARHWRLVPAGLQQRWLAAYARGLVPDRDEYLAATALAVDAAEGALARYPARGRGRGRP